MRRIIIAPDSYKGTLSAIEACNIIEKAALESFPQLTVVKLPMSDGGEGFADSMYYSCGGEKVTVEVKDPLWRDIRASYVILQDGTAVIEMAAASGLTLLRKEERNPLETTSYGTGQLIAHALEKGCERIILGLGGSATNDGGIGMGAALGMRFLNGNEEVPLSGKGMEAIDTLDCSEIHPGLKKAQITIACDVTNPMYGENGAAYVFGPQKGADQDEVKRLDFGLRNFAKVIDRSIDFKVEDIPGSGAAGGMAGFLLAFANAKLRSGLDIVLEAMQFEKHLKDCDLVITGEGRTDRQSAMGKVISGIGSRTKKYGIPLVVLSGTLEEGSEMLYEAGVTAMFSACRNLTDQEELLKNAETNLYNAAKNLFRLLKYTK